VFYLFRDGPWKKYFHLLFSAVVLFDMIGAAEVLANEGEKAAPITAGTFFYRGHFF